MSNSSQLEVLAETISAAAKVISGYCTLNESPQLSLSSEAPGVLPHTAPEYVRQARQHLLSAAKEALQLASDPSEYLPMLAIQVNEFPSAAQSFCYQSVFNICEFSVSIHFLHQMAGTFSGVCRRSLDGLCPVRASGKYLFSPGATVEDCCSYGNH